MGEESKLRVVPLKDLPTRHDERCRELLEQFLEHEHPISSIAIVACQADGMVASVYHLGKGENVFAAVGALEMLQHRLFDERVQSFDEPDDDG